MVPLVHRGREVEPLVALEADQARLQDRGEDLTQLGLADAGLPFQEERLAQLRREEDGGRRGAVGEVALARHRLLDGLDATEHGAL